MKAKDLKIMVENGHKPIIRFKTEIEDLEYQFEEGMIAEIYHVYILDDETVEFLVDESKYLDYNLSLEKPVWRNNENGRYDKKYSELYDRKTMSTFLDGLEIHNFEIIDENLSLITKYINSDSKLSYVEWLEEMISYYQEVYGEG